MFEIEIFWHLTVCKKTVFIINWIVWNTTVSMYKNVYGINNLQWLTLLSFSLSLSIYIYIHIYTSLCVVGVWIYFPKIDNSVMLTALLELVMWLRVTEDLEVIVMKEYSTFSLPSQLGLYNTPTAPLQRSKTSSTTSFLDMTLNNLIVRF